MGFSGSAPENKPEVASTPAAAPAAAPAANNDIIAVIAAAIAACAGGEQIASIKRLSSASNWANYSRVESVTARNQMY